MRILIIWLALCCICSAEEKKPYVADLETRLARVQARKELKAKYRQEWYLIKKYGYWEQYQYQYQFKRRY